jgi:DNA-directed RNA polymerase subunit N (RpoN/RPB10)
LAGKTAMPRETEFTEIGVDKLLFDPANPRFGKKSAQYTISEIAKQQDRIQRILEGDPHYALRLVESFKKNGFIRYEPLVVRELAGKYVVIEGNRRLAAVHYIHSNPDGIFSQELIEKLKNIPVLVFHEAEDQSHIQDMRVYLGVRHLFGFKDWPAESKATFLDEQIHSGEDLERTVDELGIKKTTVRRYLVPFRMVRKAKQHLKGISDQEFWILGEALSRSGIPEYIELEVNPDTFEVEGYNLAKLRKLIDFLYGEFKDGSRDVRTRKITDTRDSSNLAKVLSDSTALGRLEHGASLDEALLEVQTPTENVKRLRRLIRELTIVVRNVATRGDRRAKDLKRKCKEFSEAARHFLDTNA